jgi:hypothetical protein
LLLLLLAIIFTFPGCSARSAITADTFQKEAKNCGYTVKQASSTNPSISSYYTGTTSSADDELDYVLTASDSSALEIYNSMKNSIETGGGTPQPIDSSSYSKYVVTNGEMYYVLTRVDKTVVYAKSTSSNKANVDKFFNAIKY